MWLQQWLQLTIVAIIYQLFLYSLILNNAIYTPHTVVYSIFSFITVLVVQMSMGRTFQPNYN